MSTTASTTAFTAVDVELYQAIANGDLNAFTNALRNGANPNAAYSGWTPLTLAMHHLESRCVPFVHALVQAQADVNQPERASGSDRTPLLFALNGGSFEVTKLLLDHGANPSTPDRAGNTPLKLVESKGDPLLAALLGSAFVEQQAARQAERAAKALADGQAGTNTKG
ncbi:MULTISPECIES: ankyrin repeat domain-containing protein [Burkholderia]|uniref:ankyrin repeat domain-containing protein n=1 Tax=Burkholderia TaxID=32008 RepID=UPI00163F0EEA|nr:MULTISPECIES: ankyrin repeat domain-containing protein [Burkholderia]MBJ9926423.1 ankyrin repeat domain-containing protein [Burkholderia cenocepacia]UVS90857.1 ankyrin repeat domain-containing protein [Burkholderia glumae]